MYNLETRSAPCPICGESSNILLLEEMVPVVVDCSRCGDYRSTRAAIEDWECGRFGNLAPRNYIAALASHTIRKLQSTEFRPLIDTDLFLSFKERKLPSPTEAMDNLLLHIAPELEGNPGNTFDLNWDSPSIQAAVGATGYEDLEWYAHALAEQGLLRLHPEHMMGAHANITVRGWTQVNSLRLSRTDSKFAFFARKFDNPDLDSVFKECLYPAVEATGYQLRTVSQKAGLVDAIIEDEIRRSRFLIADLSDDNAGAYWEAGFAEGLGKPVIYICKSKDGDTEKRTHFDANHRHTVRWDLTSLDVTAVNLKAVIRNTLLSEAKHTDE